MTIVNKNVRPGIDESYDLAIDRNNLERIGLTWNVEYTSTLDCIGEDEPTVIKFAISVSPTNERVMEVLRHKAQHMFNSAILNTVVVDIVH